MDSALRAQAEHILAALPASLEMPAGTGKTQIVAAIAAIGGEQGRASLILTHTHAGVDAIRRRLASFGVPKSVVHVDTITGWAFDLVRSYPMIAGVTVPEEPDWTQSDAYIRGAIEVARSSAIQEMHSASFGILIVDEYQDCDTVKHDLVLALAGAIPASVVLGDRLQGIFNFGGQQLVDWDSHVFRHFPLVAQDHVPHRWIGHNQALGEWLLSIRPTLMAGAPLDLSAVEVEGFTWSRATDGAVARSAFLVRPVDETVLVLGQWARDADELARGLNGKFGVMEDIQGNFMIAFLSALDRAEPDQYAVQMAEFAKQCFVGLSGIDRSVLDKLRQGAPVAHLSRANLQSVLTTLDALNASPSFEGCRDAMRAFDATNGISLFKKEAWRDARKAIERATHNAIPLLVSLAQVRDAVRHTGRRTAKRIVSRTVLVKGLEFDHVIIADASALRSNANLYVALTRARKSVTVFNNGAVIRLP